MKPYTYLPSHPDTIGWKKRHLNALEGNGGGIARPKALQQSVAFLIRGWCGYAEAHAHSYEDGIGSDSVLSNPWFAIGMEFVNYSTARSATLMQARSTQYLSTI